MNDNLVQNAIDHALKCEWDKAIKVNKQIIESNKLDIDALNRLAHAYYELGDSANAKIVSKKVLKIDSQNKIAKKALLRYQQVSLVRTGTTRHASATDFLMEPGKTKLVSVINIGSEKNIASLSTGDEVYLSCRSHRVTINTRSGKYIGKLPDNIAARLRILVKGGNKYRTLIKSITKSDIKIFIKELQRGKGFENTNSFTSDTFLEPISELNS